MNTWYWIFEYGKVFCGYIFLMFLWPSAVFGRHLSKKTRTYRFSFCVTVQIVIVNTVVLGLGIFHMLYQPVVIFLFYGGFVLALLQRIRQRFHFQDQKKMRKYSLSAVRLRMKESISEFWEGIYHLLRAHSLLLAVVMFGLVYFSYGAFQVHSYGFGDLYVHHEWINGLREGKIFSGGVYPAAMHCFVYCMNILFGIQVNSILIYLQCIHVAVLFFSAYILLREIFCWRYTPIFVFMMFLTLDLANADQIQSMSRLQITLPQEFGLHTVFLCAFHLIEYLKNTNFVFWGGKLSKCYWDKNLFLFMMSVSAVAMTHFHTMIMTFLVCISFAVFAWKKIMSREYLIPLAAAVVSAGMIAAVPMASALASGIPFNDSITWAVNAMSGEESRSLREQKNISEEADVREDGVPGIERKEVSITASVIDRFIHIYENGYAALYGAGRAKWVAFLTMTVAIFCCRVLRKREEGLLGNICSGYPPAILVSFLYILVYAAPMVGLPDIIPEGRFFVPGHMMTLAIVLMPADIMFSIMELCCGVAFLKIMTLLSVAGIYVTTLVTGSYRGYLFYELTRYESVVSVTESIKDSFPQSSYTVVAPTDEVQSLIGYGWHEELLNFVEQCESDAYTLPSEHVFVYVEKRPLLYAQCYFLQGSYWLGCEKYLEPYWEVYSEKYPDSAASQSPEIIASEISKKEARKNIPEYTNPWLMYKQLESRTIVESKAYEWCHKFSEIHPAEMNIYYEDDDFVCYYFRQDTASLYNLALGME